MCIGNVYTSVHSLQPLRESADDSINAPKAEDVHEDAEPQVQVPGEDVRAAVTWVDHGMKQVLRLVDERTEEVVLQIPSDALLKVSASISALTEEQRPSAIDLES